MSGRSRASCSGVTGDSAVNTAQQVSNVGTASRGIGTGTSSTSWPSDSSNAEASSHASRHSGSTSASAITGSAKRAIRSRPGSRSQAARNVEDGGGAHDGSPGRRPASTSSMAAASRTVRASEPPVARPVTSPYIGQPLMRPRVGFSPTSPQHEAGMRIEPATVGALRDRHEPGGDRGSGPSRRASCHPRAVPGRHGRRCDVRLGVAGRAELRRVRLAQADHPGVPRSTA